MMGRFLRLRAARAWSMTLAVLAAVAACHSPATKQDDASMGPPALKLTRQQLLDPRTCAGCHPVHYRQWASSMHAYAAEDPVFIAMNARGQRETDGALGDFCVRCHAPMALIEGATQDGTNLSQVDPALRGVTCFFCHSVVDVDEHFNNGLTLADDAVLRGSVQDPMPSLHDAAYSRLHDGRRLESSRVCGSCHDVVTPNGVHLERTLSEYEASLFGREGPSFETCQGCHMPAVTAPIAVDAERELPERLRHEHLWPGVDVALTPFPDREAYRNAVECVLSLSARIVSIAHDGFGGFTVSVDTFAGHNQPSGAAQDRRLWLEVAAFDEAGEVIFDSGVVADDEPLAEDIGVTAAKAPPVVFRDWLYDADERPVHMFWEAAPSDLAPLGYRSGTLPPAVEPFLAHTLEGTYRVAGYARVARLTARLRMRPMGLSVLQDLVDSSDLDPAILDEAPTFTLLGAVAEWTPEAGFAPAVWPDRTTCRESYRCAFDADAPDCASASKAGAETSSK